MRSGNLTTAEPWSDAELDNALFALCDAAGSMAERSAATSPVVEPGADPARSSHWRRPALIAAAVVVLVGSALAVPALYRSGGDAAAASTLNRAADAADRAAADGSDVIPAGHYRYTVTHAWYASMSTEYTFLQESEQQVWTPADWHDTWLERRTVTGDRKWIHGSERDAAAAGLPKAGISTTEPDYRGPCQDYFTSVCTGAGSWQSPTIDWIAGLPTDADGMYRRLYQDSKGHGQSQESEMLVQATDALRTGLLPASARADLYRAMAKIDGIEVADRAVNLDGSVGVGFTVDSEWIRDETIIDPDSGDFVGERQVVRKDDTVNHIPAGTVIGYTAVTSSIVAGIGQTG